MESDRSKKSGKNVTPSDGIIDSQSAETASCNEQRGIDGGKKVKKRMRHIVVDAMGNLIQVVVYAANIHDAISGCDVLKGAAQKHASFQAFSGDARYRGSAVDFVEQTLNLKLHISKKRKDAFAVFPIRRIVERTFAWLDNFRRLSKDYEILTSSAENMVRIAMLQIAVRKCV